MRTTHRTLEEMDTPVDDVVLLRPEHEPVPEDVEHARLVDMLFAGFSALLAGRNDHAVFERLAWFPDREDTRIRLDPDVMIVRGRPPGYRSSYKAWMEQQVPPALLIEVVSKGDAYNDYVDRLARARHHGVGEVLLVYPFTAGGVRVELLHPHGQDPGRWETVAVSIDPSNPIRLDWLDVELTGGEELVVHGPDGTWLDTTAAHRQLGQVRAEADRARAEADRLRRQLRSAGLDPDAP